MTIPFTYEVGVWLPRKGSREGYRMSDPSSDLARTIEQGKTSESAMEIQPELAARPIAPLLRIPGMQEDAEPRRLTVGEKTYSIADVVALSQSKNEKSQRIALKILGALDKLNRSELHLAGSALYTLSHESSEVGKLARESLYQLIVGNSSTLEALHLGCQILKKWPSSGMESPESAQLTALLNSALKTIRLDPEQDRKQCVEQRYVLVKALEVEELRTSALESIRVALSDSSEIFAAYRRELAGNILAFMRLNPISSPLANEVKRLASPALTSGLTTAHIAKTRTVDIDRSSICTTALEAEARRQFGLACSIEMSKAVLLLGRPMRLEEYESAIRFGSAASPHGSTNRSWFSKDEWNTTERLLRLALKDAQNSREHALSLLYVLATRIKAEDHSDPRDSRRRPDTVGSDSRARLLKEMNKLCEANGIDIESVRSLAAELVARTLPAPFDTWRYEHHVEPTRGDGSGVALGKASSSDTHQSESARAKKVISKLLRDDNPTTVMRMIPEELHVLRQVEDLSLEEFKVITQRLNTRAVSDPWARTVILDLVRLPHAVEVTAKVRTATLGALISEARRLGRLSVELEKEVFAVSAEIPSLPFLGDPGAEDQEFLLEEQDEDY